ncbi:uncharacterized protein [Physcomitrium patens]|uniref:Uncharacterized protein n=1 Tax=Physcomitrium patens TaxID=3218 RepID=A0A7I4CQ39_PHYPA|nr:uncharacterized protein LOC112276510 [Physcomitrium patens]|eukprot:XP_024363666.1 uncharacterized protein LOC112276510 [Physcomitrella patens]
MDSILKSRKRLAFSRSVVVALCLGFIGGMVLQSITGMPPLLGDGRFVLDAAGSRSIQPVRRCDCVQNATHEIQPPSGVPSTGTGVQKLDQSSPPPCWRNETVELVPPSEGSTNQIGSQNCLRDESEYEWRAVKKLPQQFIHTNSDYHRRNYTKLPPQDKPPLNMSLLAMAVGFKHKTHVDAIVRRFSGDHFQVVLFHYDNTVDKWRQYDWFQRVLHIQSEGQGKWWFAKRFLHPDVVAPYEYIFIWDEDLNVKNCDPHKFIDVMRRNELQIAQPGLEGVSHWPVTRHVKHPQNETEIHLRTSMGKSNGQPCSNTNITAPPCAGYVEIMAPVIEHKVWRCVWHMIHNDLIGGWGLDFLLHVCVDGPPEKHIGIVDSQFVVHDDGRSIYAKAEGNQTANAANDYGKAVLRRNYWELEEYFKRWGAALSANNTKS